MESIFPSAGAFDGQGASPGLSLRDYFAAAALQGLLAHQGADGSEGQQRKLAALAYASADALLAARKRQAEA